MGRKDLNCDFLDVINLKYLIVEYKSLDCLFHKFCKPPPPDTQIKNYFIKFLHTPDNSMVFSYIAVP